MKYIVKVTLGNGEQYEGYVVHPDGPQGPKPKDLQQAREMAKNMKWLDSFDGDSVNLAGVMKLKVREE